MVQGAGAHVAAGAGSSANVRGIDGLRGPAVRVGSGLVLSLTAASLCVITFGITIWLVKENSGHRGWLAYTLVQG